MGGLKTILAAVNLEHRYKKQVVKVTKQLYGSEKQRAVLGMTRKG